MGRESWKMGSVGRMYLSVKRERCLWLTSPLGRMMTALIAVVMVKRGRDCERGGLSVDMVKREMSMHMWRWGCCAFELVIFHT